MRKADASLNWFHVAAKKAMVDAAYSVMVVEAAPSEPRKLGVTQIGIFVVSAKTNQVRLVLDRYPLSGTAGFPTVERATTHAAYVHFYSDYGLYGGSIKYIYNLSSQRPPLKIRYGMLALTSSAREDGKLRYTASFGQSERHATIVIEPRAGDAARAYSITEAPAPWEWDPAAEPAPLATTDGQSVIVANKASPASGP